MPRGCTYRLAADYAIPLQCHGFENWLYIFIKNDKFYVCPTETYNGWTCVLKPDRASHAETIKRLAQ